MNINRYYIRVTPKDSIRFEQHLLLSNIPYRADQIPTGPAGTCLYIVDTDKTTELSLKLSFSLIGCVNINETLKN